MASVTSSGALPRLVLIARPLGYLLVTLVYLVLFLAMAGTWIAPFFVVDRGWGADVDVTGLVLSLLIVVLIGPVLGPALVLITSLTLSLTVLGGLALVRSLLPRYADGPLTATVWSDSTVGPPRLTKGALSLLPVHPTPFARWWVRLYLGTTASSFRVVMACGWIGAAYLLSLGWVRWPATGAWLVVWALASAALLAVGVRSLVRAVRLPPRRRSARGRLP